MVLTLYGHPMSYTTQTVLIVLAETKTPYVFETVDLRTGAHKTPEFLAKNPLGQIPCMDDDGFVLFESMAIARYIVLKASSPLVPVGDLHAVALHEQALAVEETMFSPTMYQLLRQRVFTRLSGGTPDEAVVAASEEKLTNKLPAYEALLAKRRYLAGDHVTLADLAHLPLGVFLEPQGYTWFQDKEKYPNTARWWADISARQSWREVQEHSKETFPPYVEALKPRA